MSQTADKVPDELTGQRIRERRMERKLRQGELADMAGISASYLNLIEHNKRPIGGKLLQDIARALAVEPNSLTKGAGAGLLNALGAAAATAPEIAAEMPQAGEFAARFPGWAALVAAQESRLEAQERTLEALKDRLSHDPFLNASLHEVLSTVTAIRATAAILNEGDGIDAAWQARFHRNLYEDSQRLADGSQALVAYLEQTADADPSRVAPLDEAEAWFTGHDWCLDIGAATISDVDFGSHAGRALAERWCGRFRQDAARLPEGAFRTAWAEAADPYVLATTFGVDFASILRRWAVLSDAGEAGLVVCDGSGTPIFRRSVDAFMVPSFGAGCPLWPLYTALSRPGTPLRAVVEQAGSARRTFLAYAVAQPSWPQGFGGPVVHEGTMLLLPDAPEGEVPVTVGSACRICPRPGCPARREPSVIGES